MNISIKKGDRVIIEVFHHLDAVVAGIQPKFCASSQIVEGEVTHIRGDHPTNPTSFRLWVRLSEGEEIMVHPDQIRGKGEKIK